MKKLTNNLKEKSEKVIAPFLDTFKEKSKKVLKPYIEQLKKEAKVLLVAAGLIKGEDRLIGLDLGSIYFKAVRVKKNEKEFSVKDSVIKELDQIKDLKEDMHITSEEGLSLGFDMDDLAIRRSSIPLMPKEEIEEALRWELKDDVDFDIDKARIKFSILGEREQSDGSKKIDLVAVVYKEENVEQKVNELKNLGLNIEDVFPAEFGLVNYVNNLNIIPPGEKVGIVDIGSVKTRISVIENGKLCFSRHVPIGGDTITEAMTGVLLSDKGKISFSKDEAEKLKCEKGIPKDMKILSLMRPVLEKLSNQIKRSMDYYEHRFNDSVEKIILAGGGSKLKGIKGYLSKEIDIEVLEILPEIACASGLTLIDHPEVDIIPEHFKLEKRAILKKMFLRITSFTIASVFFVSYLFLSVKAVSLNNQIKSYESYQEAIKDLTAVKDKMALFSYAVNTVSYESIDPGSVMKELSNLAPSYVLLDDLVIKDKDPHVKLSGVILRGSKLSKFMSNLESSSLFEKVKLVFSRKSESYSSDSLDFEIVCNVKDIR